MATSSRKYSDDQIRFVLVRWDTVKRPDIVVQYRAEYNKDPKDFSEKHAKYIKDSYAGNPRFVYVATGFCRPFKSKTLTLIVQSRQEFGHLRSDRQIQNARLKEEAKQAHPVSAPQGYLPAQNATAVPVPTPPYIGGPQTAPSSSLGGATNSRDSPAGTINAVGLGLLNTPVSTPIPLPVIPPRRVTPLPGSSTPASSANALPYGYHNNNPRGSSTPKLPPSTLGTPGAVWTSLPPRTNTPTAVGAGSHNNNPGFVGQPGPGSGIRISPPAQNAYLVGQPGPGFGMRISPTQNAHLVGQVGPGFGMRISPPTQNAHLGVNQGLERKNSAPPTPHQSAGMMPSMPFVSPSLPSAPNPSQWPTVTNQQSVLPPFPAQPGQANANPMSTVSTPPSHIQLPIGDFDKDGVWYNGRHDGCQINARNRHNNNGSILPGTMTTPIIQGLQGTKRARESISPITSSLDTRPKESIHVAAQPLNATHSAILQHSNGNSKVQAGSPKFNTQLGQPGYNIPAHGAMSMVPAPASQQPQATHGQPVPNHAQRFPNQHVSQSQHAQSGSPFPPQGTIVAQPVKGPNVRTSQGQHPPRQNVNQHVQFGGPLQPQNTAVFQPVQPRSQFPPQGAAVAQPAKEPARNPPVLFTPGQVLTQQPPSQNVNQQAQLGSPFQAQGTIVVKPVKDPNVRTSQGQPSPRLNVHQPVQMGSTFPPQNTAVSQPAKGPSGMTPPMLLTSGQAQGQQSHHQNLHPPAPLGSPFQYQNAAGFQPPTGPGGAIGPISSAPNHAQQSRNQYTSQPPQLGGPIQPQGTAIPKLSTGQGGAIPTASSVPNHAHPPPKQHMNHPPQVGGPIQPQGTAVPQLSTGQGGAIPTVSSVPNHARQPPGQHTRQPAPSGSSFQPQGTIVVQPSTKPSATVPPVSFMPGHGQPSLNQHVSQPAQLGSRFRPQSTTAVQASTAPSVNIPAILPTPAPATTTVRAEHHARHQPDIAKSTPSTFLPSPDTTSPTPVLPMEPDVSPIPKTNYETFARLPDTVDGKHYQENLFNNFADYPWTEPMGSGDPPIVDFSLPKVIATGFSFAYGVTDNVGDAREEDDDDADEAAADEAVDNLLSLIAFQRAMKDGEGELPAKRMKL